MPNRLGVGLEEAFGFGTVVVDAYNHSVLPFLAAVSHLHESESVNEWVSRWVIE